MKIHHIESLGDPRLEPYREVRERDLRGRLRLFIAESEMVVRRLSETPERLHSVLVSPPRLDAMRDALDALPESVPVYVADVDLMTQVAGFHIHRGVLAAGVRPTAWALAPERALAALVGRPCLRVLVAEGLTNVDNIGALFRNAAAFGADAVVLDPTCCDPLYRKAIRVSMGHVFRLPWAVCRGWPDDLEALRTMLDLTLIGAEIDERARPLWSVGMPPRAAFVLGSEAHGLTNEVRELCDELAEVPMADGVESLNVSVASALMLYEHRRRQ